MGLLSFVEIPNYHSKLRKNWRAEAKHTLEPDCLVDISRVWKDFVPRLSLQMLKNYKQFESRIFKNLENYLKQKFQFTRTNF